MLEPGATLGEPFIYDTSGMSLEAAGAELDVVRVASVLEGTPAAQAGVLPGDVLLEINGRAATRLFRIRETFRTPGRYELLLRRGDRILKLFIETRTLI